MRRDLWATLENYRWHEATLVTLCGAENVSALNAQQQVQEQTGWGAQPPGWELRERLVTSASTF